MNKGSDNETTRRKLYIVTILVLITMIDLVLILNSNKKRYTVVFIDGDMVSPFVVKEKDRVEELENKNEDFIGWYLGDNKYDFNEMVTTDLVLKAKYEETIMYKVTFDSDGGSTVSPVMVKGNKTLVEPDDPVKENYRFKAWMLGDSAYDFNTPVTNDFTLKAFWEEVPKDEKTYTITFDSDGGSDVKELKVRYNEYATKPTDPTKEGYVFKAWYSGDKMFSWNFPITSDISLKATWTARISVKITFDSAGGSSVSPLNVYKGETTDLPTPTKAGYIFNGWYYGKVKYTNQTPINSSIKLKASWITVDESNVIAAMESIKESYEILKGGTKIKVTYAGCNINNTNGEILDEIRRDVTDKTLTLNFTVVCGSVKKSKTAKAIIKASTYTYTIKDSTLKLNGTNYDGELFKLDGTKIANVLGGSATVSGDFETNLLFMVRDDDKTTYVIKKSDK